MNSSVLTGILFAQISNWQRLGDGLHRSRRQMDLMELLPLALGLVVVAIVITIVVKVRKRNDMTQRCDDPNKLFRELSLAHNLDRASRNLLWRLAEALQLAQPAEVFLQPAHFQGDRIPQELRDEEAELQELLERLF
ncbi:MAG: hypothetical protein GXP24_06310 [Planctomycetes bacterium]|nr:hypothetical protein [Planctomycetota bacterium]